MVPPEFQELLSSGKALKGSWGSIFRKLNCVFSPKQGELSSGLGIFAVFVNCFGPKIQNRGSSYPGSMLRVVIPGMWSGWVWASGVRGLSLLSPSTDLPPPVPPPARLYASSKLPTPSRGVLSVPFDRYRLMAQRG